MPKRPASSTSASCPCGLPASYAECCGRFHRGEAKPPTAELLMRSRYSAFAVQDEAYLLSSWHPSTRPPAVGFEPGMRWEGLTIVGTTGGSAFDKQGTVEFRARYTQGGRDGEMHEVSRFVRDGGAWSYLNGTVD
ncbi:YchJ family protein [Actinomadura barringtoniae]|nr:YchJ family protein [Actinomadura barringtoniae]